MVPMSMRTRCAPSSILNACSCLPRSASLSNWVTSTLYNWHLINAYMDMDYAYKNRSQNVSRLCEGGRKLSLEDSRRHRELPPRPQSARGVRRRLPVYAVHQRRL